MDGLTGDLDRLDVHLGGVAALLDRYAGTASQAERLALASRADLAASARWAGLVLILFGIVFALGQLVPLWLGSCLRPVGDRASGRARRPVTFDCDRSRKPTSQVLRSGYEELGPPQPLVAGRRPPSAGPYGPTPPPGRCPLIGDHRRLHEGHRRTPAPAPFSGRRDSARQQTRPYDEDAGPSEDGHRVGPRCRCTPDATGDRRLSRRHVWVVVVAMDAITMFKEDHQAVERLFKRFEKAGDHAFAEKRRLADRIVEALSGTPRSKSRFSIP